MLFERMSSKGRWAIVSASFVVAGLVGLLDAASSAYIAFSIFYVVPIALAAWYGNRTIGVVTAVASGLGGFVADIWATNAHHLFAWVNLGLRLVLFILVATMIARLTGTVASNGDRLRVTRGRGSVADMFRLTALDMTLPFASASEARPLVIDR